MLSDNLPVDLNTRDIRLPKRTVGPEKVLVAANVVSLSRGVAAVAVFVMSLAGVSPLALLAVAAVMWLTDVLDGRLAHRGWDQGAAPRTDGAALDPLMDDMAFISVFLVLLGADAVPVWFVAGLFASRVLFALIRTIGLAYRDHFARSEPVTKVNGAVLAVGQLLLLAHVGLPGTFVGSDEFAFAIVAVMTGTTVYSVFHFAGRRHGRVLVRLLIP